MVNRSGQVLVLVLLVVVVALAIGLSVASRNITNLKTATQSERSQRAFSAAEGGIEDVLSRLNQVAADIALGSSATCTISGGDTASCPVTVGDISASVDVKVDDEFESRIELGSVGQIDLNPNITTANRVRIDWSIIGGPSPDSADASIEVIEYYKTSGGVYGQNRRYFQGTAGGANETPGPLGFSLSDAPCTNVAPFDHCAIIDLQTLTAGFQVLRIRPFWGNSTVHVSSADGGLIPPQTYNIESTARTDEGLTRKVLVTRNALPALPAAFDYALFSSGSITK